jgi:1-acyl-sn-glycerol-3-phosphate acyltransferase
VSAEPTDGRGSRSGTRSGSRSAASRSERSERSERTALHPEHLIDAGPIDVGLTDAGPIDVGPIDAGLTDARLIDISLSGAGLTGAEAGGGGPTGAVNGGDDHKAPTRARTTDADTGDDNTVQGDSSAGARPGTAQAAAHDPPGAGSRTASMSILPVARARPDDSGPDTARRSDVDEWGRSEHMRSIVRRLYNPVYRHWFRVEWDGLEKIPLDGGALLICNHAGAIPSDAPAIMHGIEEELGRPVYGMADYFFRTIPVVGTMWSRTGGVPAHPDNAYRLLHDQHQLALVFPEGTKATSKTYSDRYRLRRFGRGGFVEIAMRAGVPIVPIACVGAEESMPIVFRVNTLARALKLPYFPVTVNSLLMGPLGYVTYFPVKLKFRVLDPISFDVEPGLERYSRSRVMDEAESIRATLQDAIHDMLRERRSIWFG